MKAAPEVAPVAETFERELESIREKEKDLKGEQRKFFSSIVERVKNNVDVLAELRQEHTALRATLNKLIEEKRSRTNDVDLATAIKHRSHEVNLLTKQIDMLKHKKEDAMQRQVDLEIILTNYRNAAESPHPELDDIQQMNNKLDNANIKNNETKHLMKIYQGVIAQFDRQQMLWNPLVREQQEQIAKKDHDISELFLIARDSEHSKTTAKTEFSAVRGQCTKQQKKRETEIGSKKRQLVRIGNTESTDASAYGRPARAQAQISSTPSQLKSRMNRQLREKREEKFRQASVLYERVREAFGTNDPDAIETMFREREDTSHTLNDQISALKVSCKKVQKEIDSVQMQIEEQEFTTARGVGSQRMLHEGGNIMGRNEGRLRRRDRKIEAFQDHQKQVCVGIAHFVDLLSLVTCEAETVPSSFPDLADWVTAKAVRFREMLEDEDSPLIRYINTTAYLAYKARNGELEEEVKKHVKREGGFKRAPKDQKGDVQTRVLDRNAVKAAAAKALQVAQQQRRQPGRR